MWLPFTACCLSARLSVSGIGVWPCSLPECRRHRRAPVTTQSHGDAMNACYGAGNQGIGSWHTASGTLDPSSCPRPPPASKMAPLTAACTNSDRYHDLLRLSLGYSMVERALTRRAPRCVTLSTRSFKLSRVAAAWFGLGIPYHDDDTRICMSIDTLTYVLELLCRNCSQDLGSGRDACDDPFSSRDHTRPVGASAHAALVCTFERH